MIKVDIILIIEEFVCEKKMGIMYRKMKGFE